MPSKQDMPSTHNVLRVHAGQKPATAPENKTRSTLTFGTFVSRADRVTTTDLLEVLVATPAPEAAAERCIRAEAILVDGYGGSERVRAVDERERRV